MECRSNYDRPAGAVVNQDGVVEQMAEDRANREV